MTLTIDLSNTGHWLVLLLIAALAGLLVEVIRGGAIPLTFVGEIIFAFAGAWVGGDLLARYLPGLAQPQLDGVALLPAIAGALVVGFLWGSLGGRRRRGY